MSSSKKPQTREDVIRARYEYFVKSGGSSRQNVNDLLKAIVEAILDEDAYSLPKQKPVE